MALSESAREALYLRNQMLELGLFDMKDITIGCDNHGARHLVEGHAFHPRTKHIDVRHHFVRDLISQEKLKLTYIPTNEMPADVLTKPLPSIRHHQCVAALGMRLLPNKASGSA